LPKNASNHVGRAARTEWNDYTYRPCRIGLIKASSGFLVSFTFDLKIADTLTWMNKWNTQSTQQVGQTASATITGPAFADHYTGPVRFILFQDNVYGSFMFGPAPPPTFDLTATPDLVNIHTGECAVYTVSTMALVSGFNSSVALSASGAPVDASVTFDPPAITGAGSSTLNVCTTSSTVLGRYPLNISATSGMETHSVGVVLKVK
jgi:hypothetical protein